MKRSKPRRLLRFNLVFVGLNLVFVGLNLAVSTSWTSHQLNYYDNIRLSRTTANTDGPNDAGAVSVQTETVSPVTRVTLHGHATTNSSDFNATNSSSTFRLCHLASMLPSSDGDGNLQKDFGLYSSGAVLLAMIHFNNRVDSIVPELQSNPMIRQCDVRFTMDFHDTEFSPIAASRALNERVLPPPGPPRTAAGALATPGPCALVGAARSAVSGPLSILSSARGVPVVSGASTSSQFDNKDIYRYFGRTVPTNTADAYVAAGYLRDVLGASHVGVLYVQDEYGNSFHREFAAAARNLDPPMKVFAAAYDANHNAHDAGARGDSIRGAVERLADTGCNYFFAAISPDSYDEVLGTARRARIVGPGKFWLHSELFHNFDADDFGYDALNQIDLVEATSGAAFLSHNMERNVGFDEAWSSLESDKALKEYYLSKQALHYDAVMALGFAACEAGEEFFSGAALFNAFTRTSFSGASGLVSFNRKTGTREFTRLSYKIINVVANAVNEKNEVTFATSTVAHTEATESNDASSMEWITTAPTTYADGGSEAPPVLPAMSVELNLIDAWALAIGVFLNVTILASSVLWASWTIKHRKSRIVGFASPTFLLMLCGGTFIMSCTVIPMSLEEPVTKEGLDVACMSMPWLFSIGFVVSFSALFCKTMRIKKLVRTSQDMRKIRVRPKDVFKPFLALFTCTLILLIGWTIVSPVEWKRRFVASFDSYGRSVESYGECGFRDDVASTVFLGLILAVDIVSVLYTVYENYQARFIPSEYFESHYVAMSVVSIAQVFIFGVPVFAAIRGQSQLRYLVLCSFLALMGASFLFPIFIPKAMSRRKDMQSKYLNSLLKVERQKTFELATRNFDLKQEMDIVRASKKRRSSFGFTSPRPSRFRRKRSSVF